MFSTLGLNYSQVCGQLRGYQLGIPNAFYPYVLNNSAAVGNIYADGVSITYGCTPRKHIWTYAGGLDIRLFPYTCPCLAGNVVNIPSFVGSDYYCETGDNDAVGNPFDMLYSNDPLWDGQQCPGVEAPCCTHSNMPWLYKKLSETTAEDIELRICASARVAYEDTPLQVIELNVR